MPGLIQTDEECFPRGSQPLPNQHRQPALVQPDLRQEFLFSDDKKRVRKPEKPSGGLGKKRRTEAAKDGAAGRPEGRATTRAQTLIYGKLSVGMKLLGAVEKVSEVDITVGLANGLTGTVILRELSDTMSDRVDRFIDDDPDQSAPDDLALPDMRHLFTIGQLVQCVVTRLDQAQKSRHIELSMRPSLFNQNLSRPHLRVGMVTPCSIVSVEHKGYVIDLGIDDVKSFLPFTETANPDERYVEGQAITGVISDIATVVAISCRSVGSAQAKKDWNLSLHDLRPGMLVRATATDILPDGVAFSFLNIFSGTAARVHLPDTDIAIGSSVKARILFIDMERRIAGLSLRPDILLWQPSPIPYQPGQRVDAVVAGFDALRGVLLTIGDGVSAYSHISQCSDKRITKLDKEFSVGQSVQCRVLSYKSIDGTFSVSLRSSVLQESLFSLDDVVVGSAVTGKVSGVEPFGLFINLNDTLRGLCPIMHINELRQPARLDRYRKDQQVAVRVLSVDREQKRVLLTMKKSLVKSSETIIADWSSVTIGTIAHGFVNAIKENGVFVQFYNGVHGFIPLSDITAAGYQALDKSFYRGQVVKVQVTHADPSANRIRLSLRIGSPSIAQCSSAISTVQQASVLSYSDDSIALQLVDTEAQCVLPMHHLSDHVANGANILSTMRLTHPPGSIISVLVLSRYNRASFLVTIKPSLLAAFANASLPSEFAQIQLNSSYHGYIHSIEQFGVFVAFSSGVHGLCPRQHLSDTGFASPSDLFQVGQSVVALVIEIDNDSSRFTLSLKPSQCAVDPIQLESHTRSYFSELPAPSDDDVSMFSNYKFGDVVNANVILTKDFGAVLTLPPTQLQGFAMSPDNVEGANIEIGSAVKGVVLDIDYQRRIVDLNLSESIVALRSKSRPTGKKSKRSVSMPVPGQRISAIVQLCKDHHMVLSLPDHQHMIAFGILHDFTRRVVRPTIAKRAKIDVVVIGVSDSPIPRLLVRLDLSSLSVSASSWTVSDRPQVGSDVSGTIIAIGPLFATVQLRYRGMGARLWIGNVTPDHTSAQSSSPLKTLTVGQDIKANVVSIYSKGKRQILDLSLGSGNGISSIDNVQVGGTVTGYVQRIEDDFLWISMSPSFSARVPRLLSSTDIAVITNPSSHFAIGQPVQATVMMVNQSTGHIDISLTGTSDLRSYIVPGAHIPCKITNIHPHKGLTVELAPHISAIISLSEINDTFVSDPLSPFVVGQVLTGRVVSVNGDLSKVAFSLRQGIATDSSPYITSSSDLTVGQIVKGYIRMTGPKGCFIELSGSVVGRCLVTDLSDKFIPDVASVFLPGSLVTAKVMSISESGQAGLSLKDSVVNPGAVSVPSINQGDIVTGVISNIKEFGVFVRIDNDSGSRLSGLAHISEIFDDDDNEKTVLERVNAHYSLGDAVRARVIRFDAKTSRISLSLKFSQVQHQDEESIAEDDDDDAMAVDAGEAEELQVDDDDEQDEEMAAAQSDVEELELMSSEDESHNDEVDESGKAQPAADHVANPKSRKSAIQKARADELALEQIERRNADPSRSPETVDDFEQLVLRSPDSSLIWCRYIALHLVMNEVNQARTIAERALVTISYREQVELLNVWIAFLNLENLYGTPQTLTAVLARAMQSCDQKKLLGRVASMHELNNNAGECHETHQTLCKKFSQSRNVWVNAASYKFRSGAADAARALLTRALKALPKRKHIRAITAFSLLEFKLGCADRGRTILEGVLSNFPKRVDLWSVYLDQEIRLGDTALCRKLFERVIHLNLSVKKMKFFFKRYLEYEREHGDADTIEHVKNAAKEFVASRM